MGVCTSGDISIYLKSVEDANHVFERISKIKEITEARLGTLCYFDLQDNHVEDAVFNCNVYSSRVQNGEFQVEQVIELINIMVKNGSIKHPNEFSAGLTVQHDSWYLDEDDFNNLIE